MSDIEAPDAWPISDAEGVRATARSSPEDPSSLEVTLPGGEVLFIPRALVDEVPGGGYQFGRSFAQALERVEGGEIRIPVMAERVEVFKRGVERERVRLHTTVHEREEVVDLPLTEEQISVERVPIERVVDAVQPPRQEGATLVYPVYEEIMVVEKRLVLREEVRITRVQRERRDPQRLTLRREEVDVERTPASGR